MERKKKERNIIWLQKQKKMKEQRRKETYSGCSDLRQIQDGTDTFQGRKPHVRGTRSRNPPSTPAKVDWVIESLNEECMSLWCVDECTRSSTPAKSVHSTRKSNEERVWRRHLRVLRHKNHIVLIPVVVVHRDEPVALLHEEVRETTDQLLQQMTVDLK